MYKTKFLSLLLLLSLSVFIVSCDEEEAYDAYANATEEDLPEITDGVPFDVSGITDCSQIFDADYAQGLCVLFNDGFEREEITGESAFNWDVLIMDYGYSGSNVDVTIHDTDHLGHVIEGEKAVLFRGRAGGSTHEIYLVSKPLDLSNFDKLYIQFRYLPIGLEDDITLSWSGESLPESIRVDVCNDTDYNCGLEGDDAHERVRDNTAWENFFLKDSEYGENLNIRNYVEQDWKLAQVYVDLAYYETRRDKMVFKISVAMDEGYFRNDDSKEMEDGIILDDVMALGLVNLE